MATHTERFNASTHAAVLGAFALGAVLVAGCSRGADPTAVQAQALRAGTTMNTPSGLTPILVTCEANQRTLVRQAVVNGEMVSQVQCVGAAGTNGYAEYAGAPLSPLAGVAMPVSYAPVADVRMAQPAVMTYPTAYPAPARRVRAAPRRVVYEQAPEYRVRSGRSWKKSALIIGSSAGIGAGVGAAAGGKRGALIGAAIGGGSATIWDQVTRRDR